MSDKERRQSQRSRREGMGHGPRMMMPVQKPKDFKGSLRRLLSYLTPNKGLIFLVLLATIISNIFTVFAPKILGLATTELGNKLYGLPISFSYIFKVLIFLGIIYTVSAFFQYFQHFIMAGIAQKTVLQMRKDVNEKLARLPLKFFDSRTHGDILSRVTNDIDTISTTLQQSVTQIITSVVTLIGIMIMMLFISPLLTLVTFIILPLSGFVTFFIAKRSQKYFKAQQKSLGQLNGHVEEMYTGHKIVKAFGYEKKSMEQFNEINKELYKAGWKAQFVSGIIFPLLNFINNIGFIFVCVVGGIMVARKQIKIGDFQAFIIYSRQFTQPIAQIANITNIIQSTIAAAERVFEILDAEEMEDESSNPRILLTDKGYVMLKNIDILIDNEKVISTNKGYVLVEHEMEKENYNYVDINDDIKSQIIGELVNYPKGFVRFSNVDFSYKEDTPLIEEMNMDIKPGQTIAIVGPTGAGKTTLVNLLMRFYNVNKGKISVDDIDINDIKREDLRNIFGMVLQDTWLFNGTIRNNIAYGKSNAKEDEIVEAAKASNADHFIRTLPDGYDTILNEEASNISQGQKQLLTIARAILANPSILILDEATSNVDTRTEIHIQEAMNKLMMGRTSFVIAHRLSTIRNADLIIVMNHGRIIEQGNHDELLEKNGFYADLYNSQFTNKNVI